MNQAAPAVPNAFGRHKVIDVDTHFSEPADLWTSRAPQSLKARVPQLKMIDGVRKWVIDGDRVIGYGALSVIKPDGSKEYGLELLKLQLEDVHPASSQIAARVAMMDRQGVAAQILYPNVLGFGNQNASSIDAQLRLASTQIYNDAMAEIMEESGQRIFGLALLPWWDPDLMVKETERAAKMGLRGVNINSDPQGYPGLNGEALPDLSSRIWDPLWEVCSALDMSVNFHIGGSELSMSWFGDQGWPGLPDAERTAIGSASLFINNSRVVGNLIYSGIIDRFPDIKFVSVESGIGWIPFMLEVLDHQYRESVVNPRLRRKPSEYFATNFYGCFWFERKNLSAMIRAVGVDNVMFETDFPHPTCLYPIDDVLEGLSGLTQEEQAKVLHGNAQKLYRIPLD
jgi:predicted TIM-barrel fold metal-dependent hydrolase